MTERFQPPAHTAPDTLPHKIIYSIRLAIDFQFNTIHRHMEEFLPGLTGEKVVDVGAGQSPFKHLLRSPAADYIGLDIYNADNFGYNNKEIIRFDGVRIPLKSASADHFICTEVLEHIEEPGVLVSEMHRMLKQGGKGVVTVPWSARYHYIPYDYHRFTPTKLASMFAMFSSVSVEPRGTDITVIVSKIIVAYVRLLMPRNKAWLLVTLIPGIVLAPVVGLGILFGHLSLLFRFGSADDPLGYTIWVQK